MIITIDGPTASGKSSVARAVAQQIGFYYLNTGMLYRALAYCLLQEGMQEEQLKVCTTFLPCLETLFYCYDQNNGAMKILFNTTDITALLKSAEIDTAASALGANPCARTFLVTVQQSLADQYINIIVEGRDSGSIVFPQAPLKFFLTADLKIRAQRWQHAQINQGNHVSYQEAYEAVAERDKNDAQRKVAPLIIPQGAEIIDNSMMSLAETMKSISKKIIAIKNRET